MHRTVPVFVQRDFTVFADSRHPDYPQIGVRLARFAELVKSPENGMHVFRMTPVTLWQAAANGLSGERIAEELGGMDPEGLTDAMKAHLIEVADRYGRLVLEEDGEHLRLSAADWQMMEKICSLKTVAAYVNRRSDAISVTVRRDHHGELKRELTRAGYPVIDRTRFFHGESLPLCLDENHVTLRDYQREAVEAFCRAGGEAGGVIVLPCGAGKTVTAIGVLAELQCEALILTGSVTSVRQWKAELLGKTNAKEDWIGEYAGRSKQVRPITIATYQMLTSRDGKGDKRNLDLLRRRNWGIIIYDEVHLLPAPVFRLTADVQTSRRLGLTATLVREDGREEDVFSLIGPKRFDLTWRSLESEGYLARVQCVEVSVPFSTKESMRYLAAGKRDKHRIAGENPLKLEAAAELVRRHKDEKILVIGQYLDQLRQLAARLSAPMISGRTPQNRRDELYRAFRDRSLNVLVVSKVANFAVDLPEASVAIQVSGGFGSRQEEAQRVGRIVRPKRDGREAWFYTLVTEGSCEKEFARQRRRFLIGQGYAYREERGADVLAEESERQTESTGSPAWPKTANEMRG
jgi:DNA excision repair protein ERCC-3